METDERAVPATAAEVALLRAEIAKKDALLLRVLDDGNAKLSILMAICDVFPGQTILPYWRGDQVD